MFPHERSLVQRYEQRPFALLGVNLDGRRETLLRAETEQRLNWRSWWDGPEGSIAAAWKVEALPAVFLIDHRGVVRFESVGVPAAEELDRRIEALVREAEGGAGT
jgi:hypothetical protein